MIEIRRSIIIGITANLLLADAGWLAWAQTPEETSAARLMDDLMWNRGPIGGPFALIDQAGKPRTDEDFRGKLLLIYFGYSYCPDVCPTDLQQIALATDVGFGGRSGNLVLDRSTTGFDPDQSLRH